MSPRLRAALIAGMVAATVFSVVTFYVNSWPGPPGPPIYVITPTLVLLAYLVVGLMAWQRHPGERIGLLFTIVGYAWFLPALTRVHAPLPFTIGWLTGSLYQASLAHLALAWPYGRLRSRLDRRGRRRELRLEYRQQPRSDAVLEPPHQRLQSRLPGEPAPGPRLRAGCTARSAPSPRSSASA